MEAVVDGYSEGIALDTDGYLSEGSGQNLFLVRDDVHLHAAAVAVVLPGITRDSVMTLAQDLGFTVQTEQNLPREMLYIADEVFFVGTAAEVTPIRSVDKIQVGAGRRGPVTTAIQQAFFDYINGVVPDRHGWLTSVDVRGSVAHAAPAPDRTCGRRGRDKTRRQEVERTGLGIGNPQTKTARWPDMTLDDLS